MITDLQELIKIADEHNLPLIIEADGSRQLPLKAPAEHEPAIPPWVKYSDGSGRFEAVWGKSWGLKSFTALRGSVYCRDYCRER